VRKLLSLFAVRLARVCRKSSVIGHLSLVICRWSLVIGEVTNDQGPGTNDDYCSTTCWFSVRPSRTSVLVPLLTPTLMAVRSRAVGVAGAGMSTEGLR